LNKKGQSDTASLDFYLKKAKLKPIFTLKAGTRLALSIMPVFTGFFRGGKNDF